MSIFKEAIKKIEDERTAAEAAKVQAECLQDQALIEFKEKVSKAFTGLAEIKFQAFCKEVSEMGYACKYEGVDQRPDFWIISLRLMPEKGKQFSATTANDCVFNIKATFSDKQVYFVGYYEQRVGKKSEKFSESYYAASLQNVELYDRLLTKFLTSSLKERGA